MTFQGTFCYSAAAQGTHLKNMEKFYYTSNRSKPLKKNKPFKHVFHDEDIEHNIVGKPLNTKYIPFINILDSKLQIKKIKSSKFFQRLNKQPLFFSNFF